MKTSMLLILKYGSDPIIPSERVATDYFDITVEKFHRKCSDGSIRLPITMMGKGRKAARGVPLTDLADYIDARIDAARKELTQSHA